MKNCILILILLITFNTLVFAEEASDIQEPSVNAQGAVLMDFATGRVLWEKNARTPLAMASTTKIMTAILALEMGNLDDVVTISQRASFAPEVKMHLKKDEQIKLGDLLYALMLQSYNDSAIAIAEHLGGTVEDFCKLMTDKARSLGAEDTVFETPNGLDSGDHHSTAYDMALITRYALNNEHFMELINTPYITVSSNITTYNLSNKNRLLNEFEGGNGVKTGFTGKAGHCFVGSAKRDDMQLISVVLASGWGNTGKEQKWIDTKRILSYGFDVYDYHDIIEKGKVAGSIQMDRSKTEQVELMYSEDFYLPMSEQELAGLNIEYDYPEIMRAPVNQGDVLGTAKVYVNGQVVNEMDLIAATSAERHDLKTSLEKVFGEWLHMGSNDEIDLVLPEF